MASDNGNRNQPIGHVQVLQRVVVEVRSDRKIYVVPDGGLDPTDPKHAAAIIDMLCSGAAMFARIRVGEFDKKLIEEVKKPEIQIVQG